MAIKNRRQSREAALRALFAQDMNGHSTDDILAELREVSGLEGDILEFSVALVDGVNTFLNSLDEMIQKRLIDWTIDRLPPVDRNVMRIGVFELYHRNEIPPAVTLNEAVEIVKKYGTPESGKFVNGVLGRILEDSPKWNWQPLAETIEVEEPGQPEPDIEIVEVEADSVEAQEIAQVGAWKLRTEEELP